MKIKVFEAFAGYGSQMMALRRVARRHAGGTDFQLVGWSEIDDDAIAAHNAVFPEYAECNHGDISKIDWERVSDFDLFTYSFPCQDISNAGLQRGLREGSGSRSSLLWECRRAIETKRPSFLLLENVAALASKKFMPDFQRWIDYLDEQGYRTFWKKINAKDFGVPQNRVRVSPSASARMHPPSSHSCSRAASSMIFLSRSLWSDGSVTYLLHTTTVRVSRIDTILRLT